MPSVSDLVTEAADQYGVDPSLALNLAMAESSLNPNAKSPAGAIGVMQLMPATAAGLGVDPNNEQQNIQGGVKFLSQLLNEFGGDQQAAIAAYNWGPGNVSNAISEYGANWLEYAPAETQGEVEKVVGSSSNSPAEELSSGISTIFGQDAGDTVSEIESTISDSIFSLSTWAIAALAIVGIWVLTE